jgi:hypothetical protein
VRTAAAEPDLICPGDNTRCLAEPLVAEDGEWLKFRHEIVRLAIEQSVAGYRRGDIHAAVLAALRQAGCDDDARLAFHAEAAGDGQSVLTYASRAAGRAAELGSHREAAAQFERALRFAAGTAAETAAGLWDGLAYEAGLLDRWQDAADAGERALEPWRRAGDRRREGATLRQLARAMWRLCRGREATAAAEAAVAIAEPLGPSADLAWAYATLASNRMLNGQEDAAVGLSRRAQALAESLHVPEALSEALNTEGCAVAHQGGQDWAAPMRRALEVAIAEGLQMQAGRAYTNLASIYSGPTARFCMTTGQDLSGAAGKVLMLKWNGTKWAKVSSPDVGTTENYLNELSCTSATYCLAAGWYRPVSHALTEKW